MHNDPLGQLTAHAPHASGPIIIRAGGKEDLHGGRRDTRVSQEVFRPPLTRAEGGGGVRFSLLTSFPATSLSPLMNGFRHGTSRRPAFPLTAVETLTSSKEGGREWIILARVLQPAGVWLV
ncbi:hypothetical protein CesoFtcFv8_024583 [Champsocephalus esox]|uniref:Uncharacterized protein n=1 Tax=Champsocephalus esox TaxID=159716 RepID=A0AAN8GF59_9TELE|nr:hypothetical protein CesoFtcFv8_024583 [Champsocephalus esox]